MLARTFNLQKLCSHPRTRENKIAQDRLLTMAGVVVALFQVLSQLIWKITGVFIRPDGRDVCLHFHNSVCYGDPLCNNPQTRGVKQQAYHVSVSLVR